MMTHQIVFVNGKSKCGCVMVFSCGGGEYSDVYTITPCAEHSPDASLLRRLAESEEKNAELKEENEYIQNRLREVCLVTDRASLADAAAAEFAEGDKDAWENFDRECVRVNKELAALYRWFLAFHRRRNARRSAAGITRFQEKSL